jgi:hypothetical protein
MHSADSPHRNYKDWRQGIRKKLDNACSMAERNLRIHHYAYHKHHHEPGKRERQEKSMTGIFSRGLLAPLLTKR